MIERDDFYKEAGWHFDDGYKVKPGDPYRKLAEQKGLHNRFLFDSDGNLVPESKRYEFEINKKLRQEQVDKNEITHRGITFDGGDLLNVTLGPLKILSPTSVAGAFKKGQFKYVYDDTNRGIFEWYDKKLHPALETTTNLLIDLISPAALNKLGSLTKIGKTVRTVKPMITNGGSSIEETKALVQSTNEAKQWANNYYTGEQITQRLRNAGFNNSEINKIINNFRQNLKNTKVYIKPSKNDGVAGYTESVVRDGTTHNTVVLYKSQKGLMHGANKETAAHEYSHALHADIDANNGLYAQVKRYNESIMPRLNERTQKLIKGNSNMSKHMKKVVKYLDESEVNARMTTTLKYMNDNNIYSIDKVMNLPLDKRPQGLSELMSVFDKNDLKKYYDKFIAGILMIGTYETN